MISLETSLYAALWFSALLLFAKIVNLFRIENFHRKRELQLGCKKPYKADVGVFGLSQVWKSLRADREKTFPDFLIESSKLSSARAGRLVTTTEATLLGQKRFITSDPVNLKAVLATQFKEFGLGDDRINTFAPVLGHGIFSSDGKKWENSRSLLRPQFVRDQVSDLELEEYHVQNLMRVIPSPNATGWTPTLDLQALFFRLTLDSATEFLFGESLDSQLAHLKTESGPREDNDGSLFSESFDQATATMATGTRLGAFYWLVQGKAFREAKAQVHKFADYYVRIGLAQNPPAISEKTPETGDKQRYVFLNALAASTRDPEEIRSQLLSILLAGRDTTASLLGWTFQLLCQHPDIYAKLRPIILSSFGTYDQPKNLSFSELKSCTYLQHIINETLRLFPVVPVNVRHCFKDTTLPRGGGPAGEDPIYVRAGEQVVYSMHVIHRSEHLWGPDANDFRPERWEGKRTGWEYLPFNGGPRICIGQQFALTEASYVIVRLVQSVEELKGVGIPAFGMEKHNLSLTNCPANGVNVQLKMAR
ncbi:cytochrome P450 [Venturia nashicola]|uniref:Cytochrome P450 n=1 Tax=Venturia nashicola TaxID=86259 RepID=A0A4Z1NYN9_9PEZI|nr:cytochrome P450 [Venturia nashicola]